MCSVASFAWCWLRVLNGVMSPRVECGGWFVGGQLEDDLRGSDRKGWEEKC